MRTSYLAPIRSRQPLTLDQIRHAAPSAFANAAHEGMSSRYAYIPTSDVIEGMIRNGFQPFAASQSATRALDRREHTKHMIRFRREDSTVTVGNTFPEIVLVNSHDGSSAYKLMAGIFRLVCSNGLIVADSMIRSIHVRHTGNVIEEVATGSVELVEHMPEALKAVGRWSTIGLSIDHQMAYAQAAHFMRFADADGKITTAIQPRQLLAARRSDDTASDLWSVFNRVQENVIKGGLTAYKPGSFQRTSTRKVKGIDQDLKLNRALWMLSERMAEIAGSN